MSDEAALLHAIHANPDDDTPRLVYADWLDEHGQPERAEFIRVQIAIANLDDHSTDEAKRLKHREQLLGKTHGTEWMAPVGPFNAASFSRGFPEAVTLGGRQADLGFLDRLPAISCLEVRVDLNPDDLRAIANLPHVESLRIWSRFDSPGLDCLDQLPCWTYLFIHTFMVTPSEKWEEFQERRISRVVELPPDQQRLAAIRYARGLNWDNGHMRLDRPVKTVQMWNINTIDAELRMLSYLPELEEIEVHRCHVTAAGLRHLSDLPNLKKIELGELPCDSLVPLMNCTTLEYLAYNPDGAEFGDESVVGLERLTKLQHLELCPRSWGSGLRDATLRRIGALRQLRHLHIQLGTWEDVKSSNALGLILEDEGSLGALSNLTGLEYLCLNEVEYTGGILRKFLKSLR